MRYLDREDAGRALAPAVVAALEDSGNDSPPLILGIPRGGVTVAAPVARLLGAELNVALARKIGAPHNPELALGAVGERGETVLVRDVIEGLGISSETLERAIEQARSELKHRLSVYRKVKPAADVRNRAVVVVDDGVATGATFRATLRTIHRQEPALLIGAVPVGPQVTADDLAADADVFVCLQRPRWFRSVGEWYDRFDQVEQAEVLAALR
jgi:putative phosphoribosyl transferase